MNLNSALVNSIKLRSFLVNHQSVRWRRVRKPFWVGVAKSKMFDIPQRFKKYTEAENKEHLRLNRDYFTHHRSFLNFIKRDDPRMASLITSDEKILADLETRIEESIKENDLWNAECARIREEKSKEKTEAKINIVLKQVEYKQKKDEERLARIEKIVNIEKALSKTYITPENIDKAIDKCLENIVQYDFAIDIKGNKYHGRETLDKRANKELKRDAVG